MWYRIATMDFVEVTETEMELINRLVKMSHETSADRSQKVETRKDWEFLQYLWDFWKVNQRDHLNSFMDELAFFRKSYERDNKFGEMINEDGKRGKMEMRHVGMMPDTYQRLIHRYFPKQDFDNKFFRELQTYIPELALLDKKNI